MSNAGRAGDPSPGPYSGVPAALPLAAAIVALLARWLPVRFEYRPNDLGIVSVATLERYPIQQETFWLLFGLVTGTLLAWLLARALRCPRPDARTAIALEALGAGGLLAVLLLPKLLAELACTGVLTAALLLAARARRAAPDAAPAPVLPAPRRSPVRSALWCAAAAVAALLMNPALFVDAWTVVNGIEDVRLVNRSFEFQAEWGQHLAWADAMRRGGLPGRDFFTLYGPLYDMGVPHFWRLVGRSITAWELWGSLTRVAAWASFLLLAGVLLRSWAWTLVTLLLLTVVELRIGLALFGLALVFRWLHSGARAWCSAAGVTLALSLLYSQEFGAALALTAALAFALRRDARGALVFAAGAALVLAPFLGWLQTQGALAPMLRDLVQYPVYMLAGYAKHPFPSLAAELPLDPLGLGGYDSRALRYGYALPAIALCSLLLALPVSAVDPRRPLASLRRAAHELSRDPWRFALALTAVFGLIAFRSALGRSSLHRSVACAAPAALLLAVAIERSAALWRAGGAGSAARRLAGWRIAALGGVAVLSGMAQQAEPFTLAARTVDSVATLATRGHRPQGNARAMRVVRWIQLHTEPGEPVLFLPNNAAYYYLTDRPSPIRFVLGSQLVTEAHRREALADLKRNPPRFVVWDRNALRADDLPDRLVFGAELLNWLEDRYAVDTLLANVEVRRLREPAAQEVDSDG